MDESPGLVQIQLNIQNIRLFEISIGSFEDLFLIGRTLRTVVNRDLVPQDRES